jgi:hypothetical protein
MKEFFVTKGYRDDVYLGQDWNKSYSMTLEELQDYLLYNNLMIEVFHDLALEATYTDGTTIVTVKPEDAIDYEYLKDWSNVNLAEYSDSITPIGG